MSKKVVRILTMLGVIFFLFMGKAYDYGAESQHGVPYSTGYVVDGKYNSIHSGCLLYTSCYGTPPVPDYCP